MEYWWLAPQGRGGSASANTPSAGTSGPCGGYNDLTGWLNENGCVSGREMLSRGAGMMMALVGENWGSDDECLRYEAGQ